MSAVRKAIQVLARTRFGSWDPVNDRRCNELSAERFGGEWAVRCLGEVAGEPVDRRPRISAVLADAPQKTRSSLRVGRPREPHSFREERLPGDVDALEV